MNKDLIQTNILGDGIAFVELVDWTAEDTLLKVVNSARISHKKKKLRSDAKDQRLVTFLWENGHTSPFRHTYYTFHIKVPLFVLRQLVKHQVGSYWRKYEYDGHTISVDVLDLIMDTDKGTSWNEVSGRYVKLDPEFYIPPKERTNGKDWVYRIKHKFNEDYGFYQKMINQGVDKEIARVVLPVAVYTEVYWTISLQAVLHFLRLRLDEHAQYECRKVAEAVRDLIQSDLDELCIKL